MANQADPTNFDAAWAAEDKGPAVITAISVFTGLAVLFCGLRLYTRGVILRKLYLDDHLILVSVIFSILSLGFAVKSIVAGYGRHFVVIPPETKGDALFYSIVSMSPAVWAVAFPKLGVVALLTRLLAPSRAQMFFLWGLAIVCALSLTMCNVIMFSQCTPTAALWDATIVERKCWDPMILVNYSIYAGTLSTITDLYLAVYPATVLFGLNMALKKKLVLSGALGIGSVATIVSIYKMTRITQLASPDFTYEAGDLAIWSCIEGTTLIIAACIPILQPLYEVIFGKSLGGSSNRPSYPHASNNQGRYGDLEMSSKNTKRRGPRDPNGLTFLDQTINGDGFNSKEKIWVEGGGGGDKKQAEPHCETVSEHDAVVENGDPAAGGGIVRTQVFRISVESARKEEMIRRGDGQRWNTGF